MNTGGGERWVIPGGFLCVIADGSFVDLSVKQHPGLRQIREIRWPCRLRQISSWW